MKNLAQPKSQTGEEMSKLIENKYHCLLQQLGIDPASFDMAFAPRIPSLIYEDLFTFCQK